MAGRWEILLAFQDVARSEARKIAPPYGWTEEDVESWAEDSLIGCIDRYPAKPGGSFAYWARRCIRNHLIDRLRRERQHLGIHDARDVAAPEPDPNRAWQRAMVLWALPFLPPKQAAVISTILRYNATNGEVARALRMKEGVVAVTKYRAIRRLQELLL